jgi:organic radical activating enzyme
MFTNQTFCSLPFSLIQISAAGNFKVCCFSGEITANNKIKGGFGNSYGMALDKNGKVMNIMTHGIQDALNSETHKSIRLAQSQNIKHPECEVCWKKEASHNHSYRKIQVDRFKDYPGAATVGNAQQLMADDGSINELPIALDLRFGNLCNAKCIHCGPDSSNKWYEDYKIVEQKDTFNIGNTPYKITEENGVFKSNLNELGKWWQSPIWWEQFDKIKHRLRYVYITGGEPFIVPAHDEFLDRLIAAGLADNIDLAYDTNLSVINPKIISRLKKFKSVNISASAEDIEDRFELIRYPLNWERFVENCKIINKEIKIVNFAVSSCIGIYSAYAPLRLIPYFGDLGFNHLRIRTVHYPFSCDLVHLSNIQKQTIIDNYKNTNIGSHYTDFINNYLTQTRDKENTLQLHSFVARMNRLDSVRGTDWKATMPDVVDLMKDYIK